MGGTRTLSEHASAIRAQLACVHSKALISVASRLSRGSAPFAIARVRADVEAELGLGNKVGAAVEPRLSCEDRRLVETIFDRRRKPMNVDPTLQCPRCKQRCCFKYQKQTRSGDEGATEYIMCDACGQSYRT